MGLISRLRSLLRMGEPAGGAADEQASCPGCGRPVANHGDLCASCDSGEERRFGH